MTFDLIWTLDALISFFSSLCLKLFFIIDFFIVVGFEVSFVIFWWSCCCFCNIHFTIPLSQYPGGTFTRSGDENFYRNFNRDRKSIVFSSKIPVGMVFGVQFFQSISNGDKIIGQFPSWVEILGYFFQRGRFFGQFFQWGRGFTGSVTQGCFTEYSVTDNRFTFYENQQNFDSPWVYFLLCVIFRLSCS